MADITMCTNNNCPVRATCYRHTAKPSERQSYSYFSFGVGITGIECDNIIAVNSPAAKDQLPPYLTTETEDYEGG